MGWVEERFASQLLLNKGVPKLWNAMRDSVGQAVIEYNARVPDTAHELTLSDCKAQGRFCRRLERKHTGASLEIYLDESNASLKISLQPSAVSESICGYRLQPSGEVVEFFVATPGGAIAKTADEASRMAIEDFLFNPFPRQFSTAPQY